MGVIKGDNRSLDNGSIEVGALSLGWCLFGVGFRVFKVFG